MKTYEVVIKNGNETKTTFCNFRPSENEIFIIDGQRWVTVYWI